MLTATIFGWGPEATPNPDVDDLKRGAIWRHCEHYYLSVSKYQSEGDHFAIRDISLEFIKTIKRFKPSTKKEAFLFMECINLSNGNAANAHDIILREEAEDDEFFEMARIDATNNSNASQYEHMKDVDGKYQLELEVEVGRETFRNTLREERARALGSVMEILGAFDQVLSQSYGGYNARDFGNVNNSNPFGRVGWFQFATTTAQAYTQRFAGAGTGGGFGPGGGTTSFNGTGATLAPPATTTGSTGSASGGSLATPSGQTSAGASTSTGEASGAASSSSARTAAKAPEPPADAMLERAKHLDKSCASYELTREDVTMAVVENHCDSPIVFHWCWVPKGRLACTPSLISNVIAAHSFDMVHGPAEDEQPVATYVVCDMRNLQHICIK